MPATLFSETWLTHNTTQASVMARKRSQKCRIEQENKRKWQENVKDDTYQANLPMKCLP